MKLKKAINKLKHLAEEFYDYTTEISVTEGELFSHYEFLEDEMRYKENGAEYEDYKKQALKDILFDFVFEKQSVESQIMEDCQNYETKSREFPYIKDMYKKLKKYIDIYVEDLENGDDKN